MVANMHGSHLFAINPGALGLREHSGKDVFLSQHEVFHLVLVQVPETERERRLLKRGTDPKGVIGRLWRGSGGWCVWCKLQLLRR